MAKHLTWSHPEDIHPCSHEPLPACAKLPCNQPEAGGTWKEEATSGHHRIEEMSKSQGIKQNTKSGGNHPQPADVGFRFPNFVFSGKYRMVKKSWRMDMNKQ